ncbi:MAG TPA: sigma-70 family RNA polymerase sigma factor [Polyangiaceae bacterium]|nr:sigma-70 family RNA polymerase sigma factor [Polyangiaceae bacterium]
MVHTFTSVSESPARQPERHDGQSLTDPGAALGSTPSFQEIFNQYTAYLWRSLLSLGVKPSEVEDVCQEVLLIVHRRLPEFDGKALRSWLYGICLRVAANHRRSARLRHETLTDQVPDRPLPADQPEIVDGQRLQNRLLEVLDRLEDTQREAFVLYEIEQLTLREVAEAVGVPLQTVYSRLEAARAAVRGAFSTLREGRAP